MDLRNSFSKVLITVVFVGMYLSCKPQDSISAIPLSLNDAVAQALLYNFDIRLAENTTQVSKANNTAGNAGMLPRFSLNAGLNYASTNIRQDLSGGSQIRYSPQNTSAATASAELDWTIFDGGRMFITKKKLNELQNLSELELRLCVLQTTYDVIEAYGDIIRQQQILVSVRKVIEYNRELLNIAQTKFNTGASQKQELLQAQIDLNINLQNEANQLLNIETAKRQLNKVMGNKPEKLFEITDTIALANLPLREELVGRIFLQNITLQIVQKQLDIAKMELSGTRASYLPLVSVRGGYYLNAGNYSEGSVLKNRNNGPQVAGTISIPLFNSGETKRATSVARYQQQAAEINLESAKAGLETEIKNIFADYDNHQQLIANEKQTSELAGELLELSVQRFRQGQTTILEVHQAQENYFNSQTRLLSYRYELKLIETRILQLSSSF